MIYHISFPQKKFLSTAFNSIESVSSGNNRFIFIDKQRADLTVEETGIEQRYIAYAGKLSDTVYELVNSDECDGVIVYWISPELISLVLNMDPSKTVLWRSYGSDINDIIYSSHNYFDVLTKRYVQGEGLVPTLKRLLRPLYNSITGKQKLLNKKYDFFRRIDYCCTTTEYEFNALAKLVPGFKAKYALFVLVSTDDVEFNLDAHPDKIMLCHSGHPINNHLDLFHKLNEFKNHTAKYIVPLSYGNADYITFLKKEGAHLLVNQFVPLTDYMALGEYKNVIKGCFAFILNSRIQQGAANVNQFLLLGAKVYLNEENPFFKEKIKQGITIFSIQNDLTEEHLFNHPLSDEEKKRNREIILSITGKEVVSKQHQYICSLFKNKKAS